MQNKLPGSLQDKFQDFGAAPNEQLWNSIAANLDEDKKRKGAFWWWFVGAAAVVVLFFGVYQLGYNDGVSENDSTTVDTEIPNDADKQNEILLDHNLADQNNIQQNIENNITPNQIGINQNNKTNLNTNPDNSKIEKNTYNNSRDGRPNLDIVENPDMDKIIIIQPNDVALIQPLEIYTLENEFTHNQIKKFPISEISKIDNSISEPKLNFEPLVEIENPTHKKHWEIGLNIGTLKGTNLFMQNDLDVPNTLTTLDNLYAENTIAGTGVASFSNLSESQVNIRRPLQFEMTLERSLTKRWNFQTGINIGFLFSNNYYSTGNASSVRSKFLSVGIPVHFNYDLIQRNRFSVYTGIGVNYEIPLFETVKTSYSNVAFESVSTKNFTKGYMISAQLNSGLRYNVNEKFILDFRPNVRYYIHQSMKSVYPALERKFWFGASLGVVWQL